MPDIEVKGLTFWAVLRCSTDGQTEKSLPAQRTAIQRWADEKGIIIGKWIELGGVSATYSQQVEPLLLMIEEKHQGASFDGLLFDSYARFVRTEADGNLLYAKAVDAELLLATVKDGLLMGEGRWAIRGSAADQAQGYTRDLGRNTARTVGQLIEAGSIRPTTMFAFGLDREYYDKDGNVLFQVRKHPDGRLEVRDPNPPHAHRYFLPRGVPRLSLREPGGRFELVPRSDEYSEWVRWMFRQHYILGKTPYWIALELNTRGVPGPAGKGWRSLAVKCILENPLYLGYSVGFVRATGVNVKRNKGYPIVLPMPRRPGRRVDGKGNRRSPKPLFRDPKDWVVSPQAKLMDFMDTDVREVALVEWHRKLRDGWVAPPKLPLGSNRSKQSDYFLSRLLTTADGHPMVGVRSGHGRGPTSRRYYTSSRSQQTPSRNKRTKNIRADVVEPEVRRAIAEVIEVPPNIESAIKGYIVERQREIATSSLDVQRWRAERKQLEDWYRDVFSVAGTRGQQILDGESKRVESRLEEIDRSLLSVESADILDRDVSEIVASVKSQMKVLKENLEADVPLPLRGLAEVLISKLSYDGEREVVEFELGLPERAVFEPNCILDSARGRTNATPASRSYVHTHTETGVILLKARCRYDKTRLRHPCLDCRRLPVLLDAAA